MTFYIGYALSLFGRSQDRLSHVLVDDEYFFQEEFFYPPPKPLWVTRNDNSGFDASTVQVTLADIPFVRLRDGLPTSLLQGKASYSKVVAAAQQEMRAPSVELREGNRLYCQQQLVRIKPIELAFYVWLLKRQQAGLPPVRWSDPGLADGFIGTYCHLYSDRKGDIERVMMALKDGMTQSYFEQRKSRTNKALKDSLGDGQARAYLIEAHGKRPETRFALNLSRTMIHIR